MKILTTIFLGFFCLFILHPLLQKGMFLDGITYAAISKNLSLHIGNVWDLYYSKTVFPHFHEHPPLVFWLQSKLFMLLGPEAPAENVYCLIVVFFQLIIMSFFWVKELKYPPQTLCILGIFWLAIPLNHLYTQNILEGTLTLFTTLAGFLLLKKINLYRNAIFCAGAIVIGVMCNGPTALFPLAIPMLGKEAVLKKSARTCFLITLVIVFFGILFLLEPRIIDSLKQYLLVQLMPSISGQRSADSGLIHHFLIFKLYLRGCWIGCIIACVVFFIASHLEKKKVIILWKSALQKTEVHLFLLISLISSLPVGLSPRLNFNYIMQSGPWMTLCLSCLCLEPILSIARYAQGHLKLLNRITMSFALVALVYCLLSVGGYRRDSAMMEDINVLNNHLPQNEIIATTPEVFFHYYEVAYFARYTTLSLTAEHDGAYFLTLKGKPLPSNYQQINLPLKYFVLSQKTTQYFPKP